MLPKCEYDTRALLW
jgi:PIN domain nuclease of toxin-antitoxin system